MHGSVILRLFSVFGVFLVNVYGFLTEYFKERHV